MEYEYELTVYEFLVNFIGIYMATMRLSRSIHLSSLHTTRGFDYSNEFNLLGIVGDNLLWLLPDPINSTKLGTTKITSQHGHPAVVRFSPPGSPNPCVLLGDLCGPTDVYDTQTSCLQRSYLEHSDKVTGIDWSSRESHLFASGSKDGTVRLYDLSLPHSHSTVTVDGSVCGVRSNQFNLNQIAFGTAHGKFFVYDTRKLSSPYLEVKGHSRTVTSVIFISKSEVLSMSLDSTAKLWDVNRTVCIENFVGHIHHTYFVGVDSIEDYILMGGEDSSVRVYVKQQCNHIACERLSPQQCFVCGCAWISTHSSSTEKHFLVLDNCSHLSAFVLTV